MHRVAIRYTTRGQIYPSVFVRQFYKLQLPKEKYSELHEQALFTMPLFCKVLIFGEQIFVPREVFARNKIKREILVEHLENTPRIATISVSSQILTKIGI